MENLGGVSGAMAAQKVLAAPADGHYVFQGSPNEVILSPLANAAVKLKAEDFRLVHPVADAVMVFVARKDLPVNSVDELIALARKSADKPLTYGSVGIGSLYHLILENVQAQTGVKLAHVPYKGNAPLLQDIGGGQVDFAVLVYSAAMGALADQGRLRVIGQLGAQRSELLKNVPAANEGTELKGFAYKIWTGFMVPRSTPEDVVIRLHAAIGKSLQDPAVRSQLAAQTQMVSAPMTLTESAKFFEEVSRYPIAATPLADEVGRTLVDHYGPGAHPEQCVTLRCDEIPSLVDVARHSDAVVLAIRAAAPDLVELTMKPALSATARFGLVTLHRRTSPPALEVVRALMAERLVDGPRRGRRGVGR